jgi:hypothetical protein
MRCPCIVRARQTRLKGGHGVFPGKNAFIERAQVCYCSRLTVFCSSLCRPKSVLRSVKRWEMKSWGVKTSFIVAAVLLILGLSHDRCRAAKGGEPLPVSLPAPARAGKMPLESALRER